MGNSGPAGRARGFPLPFFMALLSLCLPGSAGLAGEPAGAGVPAFPVINRLEQGDEVFRQYQADVENARRVLYGRARPGRPESADTPPAVSAGAALAEALTIYEYTVKGEDLLNLASRCTIPFSTIATLNRLSHVRELEEGATLYLPSMPGIFVPERPENDLELLMGSSRNGEGGFFITVRRGGGAGERFLFIPGADFHATERTFFLAGGFSFPLGSFRLTSGFGPRINPVTGNLRIHQGLDLAAPLGTDVRAARDGVVTETGEDPVYGKYVIIEHSGNWTSLYGHLSEINTALRKIVKSGSLIGRVGSTGQSTGPHLHFEIRQHGRAQNPDKLLFRGNRASQ
ncbi:MAG: M23 family metallopeptidase [Treponema sp.]|nr:M23 family metallopeptidase [Treponema sp.]